MFRFVLPLILLQMPIIASVGKIAAIDIIVVNVLFSGLVIVPFITGFALARLSNSFLDFQFELMQARGDNNLPSVADTFIILKPRELWPNPDKEKLEVVADLERLVNDVPGNRPLADASSGRCDGP